MGNEKWEIVKDRGGVHSSVSTYSVQRGKEESFVVFS